MSFGKEKRRRNTASHGSNAGQDERPTEPIVGVLRHPLVLVAENGKHYDADATANSGRQREETHGLEKIDNF